MNFSKNCETFMDSLEKNTMFAFFGSEKLSRQLIRLQLSGHTQKHRYYRCYIFKNVQEV